MSSKGRRWGTGTRQGSFQTAHGRASKAAPHSHGVSRDETPARTVPEAGDTAGVHLAALASPRRVIPVLPTALRDRDSGIPAWKARHRWPRAAANCGGRAQPCHASNGSTDNRLLTIWRFPLSGGGAEKGHLP